MRDKTVPASKTRSPFSFGEGLPALASFYDHSSLVSSLTYGNGSTKSYVYDDQQRIKQTYVDNTLTSLYNYDRLGNLVKYSDAKTGITWNHEYDLIGRATRSDASDGRYIGYTYDSFNRLYTVKENVRGYELKTVYDYDDQCNYSEKSGLVTGLTMNNSRQFVYGYDKLNRLTSKTLLKNTGFKTSYSYLEGAGENTTTALIKSVNNDGELLEYAYDQNGNITSVKKNGALLESYEYDALNQLTKVTRGSEVYTYTYDNAGNILSVKKNGTVIKDYGYSDPEWKDLLTSFNGQTITYDAIGNPLTYRGYCYDTETGFYYVSSRNYDPEVGRFINAYTIDVLTATPTALTDKNLFAYCDNNPVIRADYDGDFWHIVVGTVVGGAINAVVKMTTNALEGKSLTNGLATAVLSCMASGALAATGVGIVGSIMGNAAISMAENATNQIIENKGFKKFDVGDMLIDGAVGAASGAIGGAGKGNKHLTKLGKQTVKRTYNEASHKGLKAGVKEATKAASYYAKNTNAYYIKYAQSLPYDFMSIAEASFVACSPMKRRYRGTVEW